MNTVLQVVLKGTLFGSVETRNMFVWGTTTENPNLEGFCQNIGAKLVAMWGTIGNYILGAVWNSYAFEVYKLVEGKWQPIYETSFAFESLQTQGDAIGYQPSALIRMVTSAFKVSGRKFIAGLSEAATLEGTLVPGALAAFALYILEWMTPLQNAGASWYPGVLDKTGAFRSFTGGTIGSILSTMRRRKPGYGI